MAASSIPPISAPTRSTHAWRSSPSDGHRAEPPTPTLNPATAKRWRFPDHAYVSPATSLQRGFPSLHPQMPSNSAILSSGQVGKKSGFADWLGWEERLVGKECVR